MCSALIANRTTGFTEIREHAKTILAFTLRTWAMLAA
jgi:hypothetical protein